MKLTVLQENLSKALSNAARSVASKAQLPVLANVLLQTEQGRLKISATNLETGVNLWIGAKVEEEGAISVPARLITEFVNSLPAGNVDLEVKETSLELKSGRTKASFVGMAAGEFPPVPTLTGKEQLKITVGDLAKLGSQVVFAAATDDGRPVLTGILFRILGDDVQAVATDGYRLSVKKLSGIKDIKELKELAKGLILPAKTIVEVIKILGTGEEAKTVGLAVTPEANQVIFATSEAEVVSRLIEGEFPAFEKVIPDKSSTRVTLDVPSALRAVKTAAIFARDTANIVKLEIEGNQLKVLANAEQVGSNESEIEVNKEGEDNKIAFNAKYLVDYLNSVVGEEVVLEMVSPLGAGVFKNPSDPSYFHVIMPVRVQE